MTEEEATKLLRASEMLVKAGRGLCSRNTWDQIASTLHPTQGFDQNYNLKFVGIELFVMEDGIILPWPKVDAWGKPKYNL